MAINNKIPIVRALWGDVERTRNEVFQNPIFTDEIVITWGVENETFLKSLGYKVVCLSEFSSDASYSTIHSHFMHKLLAVQHAGKIFNEFIFLDWDCYLAKPLDDHFYQQLQKGNDIQVPLYAYHDSEGIGIVDIMTHSAQERYNNEAPPELLAYIASHEAQLRKYSWKFENMLVTPNFSFFYTRNPNVGEELIKIATENNILNCIEEHAFYLFANCTVDEYIVKFEPSVTYGTHNDTRMHMERKGYDLSNDPVIKINKYINTKVNKNIYFKHI
jgi:hypothetical protein